MAITLLERFIGSHQIPLPLPFIEPATEDDILEFIDFELEQSNTERAENIAKRITHEIGVDRLHSNWFEWTGTLPPADGRKILLQASPDSLVINYYPTQEHPISENLHIDRLNKRVISADTWDTKQNQPVMVYSFPVAIENVPPALTRIQVSRNVASVLDQVEQAIA